MFEILERTNHIAGNTNLNELLDEMLDLLFDVCDGFSGTVFLVEQPSEHLLFQLSKSVQGNQELIFDRITVEKTFAEVALRERRPILIDETANPPHWLSDLGKIGTWTPSNAIACPLMLNDKPIGVVQIYNFSIGTMDTLKIICDRMASDIHKAALIESKQLNVDRQKVLISIIGQISASLNRDQILRLIINDARNLLHSEAASLFLVDDQAGDIALRIASNINMAIKESVENVRVPYGKGIIGYVVQTGETVLVDDVTKDERHYGTVDASSGFSTRSILAVPLHAHTVDLGAEQGEIKEKIIGGLEAMNKIGGSFTEDDVILLQTLANQTATVLEIAHLYADTNELFLDVIDVLTAAIDAKDPYTVGHSKRVSEYSVQITVELGLPPELIRCARIGGLLHDVGKIGVPDIILGKEGRLTEDEYKRIKEHPMTGAKIMGQVRSLDNVVPALLEHHERLDGKGYPLGLHDEEISLIARIVSISDVFDALTSDRPYREAWKTQKAIDYLKEGIDIQFDRDCVEALIQAHQKGKIRSFKEQQEQIENKS